MKYFAMLIAAALALLTTPTPPPLTAHWERPNIARITHAPGCLYKGSTFIACYDAPGVLLLGGRGPLDGNFRPMANDIFTLVSPSGAVERAPLVGRVLLPVFR